MTAQPTSPPNASLLAGPIIKQGTAYPLFVYDIGLAIDLDEAERLIVADKQRETIKHTRKAPPYFEFRPPPLRITHPVKSMDLAGFVTIPTFEFLVYDFGAVSVSYRVPLAGHLSRLLDLSERLYDNQQLHDESRRHVEGLMRLITPALRRPALAEAVEDYVIYQIEEFEGGATPASVLDRHALTIAQILRTERGTMSTEELHDALAARVSYGPDDAAVIDWNAAVLLDRDADDVRAVLEYANVELLEMRFLDDRLDGILDDAYRAVSERRRRRWSLLPSGNPEVRRIAQLQMESAILFEGVNNALKLIGDQYLARLYSVAAKRFHLTERDQTIERKLNTVEAIYDKMNDAQATRRLEMLEWIVIILIAVELLFALFYGLHR